MTLHGTRSDPNNDSLVVMAEAGGRRVLLTGDIESEAQTTLIAAGVDLRADVVKVPHHGSAYGAPGFLAATGAAVAVISVGFPNDYGHPAPSTMDALSRLGMYVARTDQGGDVAVAAVDAHLEVTSHHGSSKPQSASVGRFARAPPWSCISRTTARVQVRRPGVPISEYDERTERDRQHY
jgi:beta-lactamase superfamily II metal-dependent hydrolase